MRSTRRNGDAGKRAYLPSYYSHPAKNLNALDVVDKHVKAALWAMGDAVVMLTGFPAKTIAAHICDDGRLIVRLERREV